MFLPLDAINEGTSLDSFELRQALERQTKGFDARGLRECKFIGLAEGNEFAYVAYFEYVHYGIEIKRHEVALVYVSMETRSKGDNEPECKPYAIIKFK